MEHKKQQSGNALVYVLIAIALFAALSFVLGRQTDTSEAGVVSQEQTRLYATQLIDYSAQVKGVVEQMSFSGTFPEQLTFFLPGDGHYESEATYANIYKIFHPSGGGLSMKSLPPAVKVGDGTESPPSGWYMGRFNNVEWTSSTDHDVLLAAFRITQPVCAAINEMITGSTTIPVLSNGTAARNVFVKKDATTPQHLEATSNGHTGSSNADLTIAICPDCEGMPSLCVSEFGGGGVYTFYSLIAEL